MHSESLLEKVMNEVVRRQLSLQYYFKWRRMTWQDIVNSRDWEIGVSFGKTFFPGLVCTVCWSSGLVLPLIPKRFVLVLSWCSRQKVNFITQKWPYTHFSNTLISCVFIALIINSPETFHDYWLSFQIICEMSDNSFAAFFVGTKTTFQLTTI